MSFVGIFYADLPLHTSNEPEPLFDDNTANELLWDCRLRAVCMISTQLLLLLWHCGTFLLLHDVLGSLQVQQIGFLSHWDPYTVNRLEAAALSIYCNMVVCSRCMD